MEDKKLKKDLLKNDDITILFYSKIFIVTCDEDSPKYKFIILNKNK